MDKVYCATVWFSTAKEQKSFALAKGKTVKQIHVEGENGETFQGCVDSFRDGGTLGLVGGLYIIGQDSNTLKARLATLRAKKVRPYDLETDETDGATLYAAAMGSILGNKKFRGDKKKHKRLSSKGGNRKGVKMAEKRDGIAAEWLLRNIANNPYLTWEQKVELLDGKISEGTLRRHYYDKG